jgi:hypothetical protein
MLGIKSQFLNCPFHSGVTTMSRLFQLLDILHIKLPLNFGNRNLEPPTQTKLIKFYNVFIIFSNFPFKEFLPSGSSFIFFKEADIMLKKCAGK